MREGNVIPIEERLEVLNEERLTLLEGKILAFFHDIRDRGDRNLTKEYGDFFGLDVIGNPCLNTLKKPEVSFRGEYKKPHLIALFPKP